MKRRKIHGSQGVSEIVGTILLLGISVSLFSIVYMSVLSVPTAPPIPFANIACKVDGNRIILEHYGGDALNLDTILMMTIGGVKKEISIGDVNSSLNWDSNNDEKWGLGERLVYLETDIVLMGKQVEIGVIDLDSNSIVMIGTLQGGVCSAPSLETHVNKISPYDQSNSPLTITATGASGLDNVTLWYRYSTNNASWNSYSSFGIDDSPPSWQWIFNFPNGRGFYEFYSIGVYSGTEEIEPTSADAMCFYNQAPEISDPYPANESIGINLIPTLNITVSDIDGDPIDIIWYSNSSGSWQIFGTNTSVSNGTYHQTNNNVSNYGVAYYWYVSAIDGVNIGTSPIYHFITEGINTKVDSLPDTITSSPRSINATNYTDVDEITLFYRYTNTEINTTCEDFDSDNGGFTPGGTSIWEWGIPTSGPASAHSGSKCWGTNLNGNYPDTVSSYLDYGPITLPTGASAQLSFWHWFNIEERSAQLAWDGGNMKISTNGGSSWTIRGSYLDPYPKSSADPSNAGIPNEPCFSGSSGGWEQVTFNLNDYSGEDVIIRWHFGSDNYVTDQGWYIDDACVSIPQLNTTDWMAHGIDNNVSDGWSWNFNFSNGTGHYEFYSIGKKINSSDEKAPEVADATCHYTNEISIFDGFETGSMNSSLWNTYQNGGNSRIQFNYGTAHTGSYSCAMDDFDTQTGDSSLNELYTVYDFTGASNINIDFWHADSDDEPNPSPASWTGHGNYDAVAFTNDGTTWYTLISTDTTPDLNDNSGSIIWEHFTYNISNHPNFESNVNSNFAIKFQQYDNYQLTGDGRLWDDVYINFHYGG